MVFDVEPKKYFPSVLKKKMKVDKGELP